MNTIIYCLHDLPIYVYLCMFVSMYVCMKYCSALSNLFFSCYIGVIWRNEGIRDFVLTKIWYKSDLCS